MDLSNEHIKLKKKDTLISKVAVSKPMCPPTDAPNLPPVETQKQTSVDDRVKSRKKDLVCAKTAVSKPMCPPPGTEEPQVVDRRKQTWVDDQEVTTVESFAERRAKRMLLRQQQRRAALSKAKGISEPSAGSQMDD